MRYEDIEALRDQHAAWRLLRADNAALVLSFLDRIFGQENAGPVAAGELTSRLDEELYAVNQRFDQARFPKSAKAYLDDWAAPGAGWLRKFYLPGSDEPHFDVTPAVERALSWVRSLRARAFVGTESRLNTIFDLLRQMVYGAEADPQVRLAELGRRRDELDREIVEVEAGNFALLDATGQRDRYQQFAATARELLADFREVEANFRALDRQLRERIAAFDGGKGELLDAVLFDRDAITDSDQGRSFQAFYDFLLSPQRQEELSELLGQVEQIDAIEEPDPRLRQIHYDWLDAGERTQATVRLLSDQLRRFLDDQSWLEGRRIMELLRGIEGRALRVRDAPPTFTIEIDGAAPVVALPMERPLYAPAPRTRIDSSVEMGGDDADASRLFDHVHVDRGRLAAGVRQALRRRPSVGLAELVRAQPMEHGLAELVAYLSLRDAAFEAVFDEAVREQVSWSDRGGETRVATLPRVTFVRCLEPGRRAAP
ncbi:MAG TPA: DUF3375 domain-containing protein [Micromonosporaceae bacterium]|nr:DUF3375 domain-containing protein [Micromonosporaceae bacterium]